MTETVAASVELDAVAEKAEKAAPASCTVSTRRRHGEALTEDEALRLLPLQVLKVQLARLGRSQGGDEKSAAAAFAGLVGQ